MKTQNTKIKELAKDYVYHVTRRNYYSANNDSENRNHKEKKNES